MRLLKRNVEMVKLIMEATIKKGDICIDATLGNGNDTIELAKSVGENGKVYSFDIQREAIQNSKEKIAKHNFQRRVCLIEDSHANIGKYIKDKIKFATFNLGYLPGGNEKIITHEESTIAALKECMRLLTRDGIISIIAYYNHEGGMQEKEAIDSFLKLLDNEKYEVIKLDKYNKCNNSPISYFIYRA